MSSLHDVIVRPVVCGVLMDKDAPGARRHVFERHCWLGYTARESRRRRCVIVCRHSVPMMLVAGLTSRHYCLSLSLSLSRFLDLSQVCPKKKRKEKKKLKKKSSLFPKKTSVVSFSLFSVQSLIIPTPNCMYSLSLSHFTSYNKQTRKYPFIAPTTTYMYSL